jgi:hypothetical protein
VGNPVIQVLLSLELGHFGKSIVKDPNSITRRLIPEESPEEGSESTVFLRGLLYDPVGSRLLEAILRCAPGKLFRFVRFITVPNLYRRKVDRERKEYIYKMKKRMCNAWRVTMASKDGTGYGEW